MKKPLSFYIGTVMIIFSLSVFTFVFYPLVQAYFYPPSETTIDKNEFALQIPKINANGKVIKDVDPWSKESYEPLLKQGIAHAKGFSTPDKNGTVFMFAHSSGNPWEITHYNTVFLRLNELTANDVIAVWYEGKKYRYLVTTTQEVYPNQVDAVKKSKADLILQTCTPIGTDWKRLLIFAKKV